MTIDMAPVAGQRRVPAADAMLRCELRIPRGALGVVVLAHGGVSPAARRQGRVIARSLLGADVATLLLDLRSGCVATSDGDERGSRPDPERLAQRLIAAIDWLAVQRGLGDLPVGCLGFGIGAASALIAAAQRSRRVAAVLACGGEPALVAADAGGTVAPTLVVPGAGRPLGELASVARISDLSVEWFSRHLRDGTAPVSAGARSALSDP